MRLPLGPLLLSLTLLPACGKDPGDSTDTNQTGTGTTTAATGTTGATTGTTGATTGTNETTTVTSTVTSTGTDTGEPATGTTTTGTFLFLFGFDASSTALGGRPERQDFRVSPRDLLFQNRNQAALLFAL